MAILTFTKVEDCSESGGQKQDMGLDGPVLEPAQQIQELCTFQRACCKAVADSWSGFAPRKMNRFLFCQ